MQDLHIMAHVNCLDEIFDRIFFKWLPDSKKNFDEARPTFYEYFNIELAKTDESKFVTKIHIPLA